MKKTIYFVTDYIFDNRDYERYQIYELKKKFKVNIISITKIVYPNNKIKFCDYHKNVKFINDFHFLTDIKKNSSHTIIIDLMTLNLKTQYLKFLLKYNNIKFVKIVLGQYPSIKSENTNILYKMFFNFFLYKDKESQYLLFRNKILSLFNNFIKPTVVISGGDYLKNYFEKKKINNVNFVSHDYHIAHLEKKRIIKKKYAVFVDSGLLGNRDYSIFGVKNFKSLGFYHNKLSLFFKKIEKIFKLRIVIAAHPKSNIKILSKKFKSFKVISNKTIELIRYCDFVMMHKSTALSSAIIYNKPVLLLSMKEFNSIWLLKEIEYLSEILNLKIVNIDDNSDFSKIKLSYRHKDYLKYKNNFLKSSDVRYSNYANKIIKTLCEL